jgi:hypothetical protein
MKILKRVLGIVLHKKCKHAFCTVFTDGISDKKFTLNAITLKILADISEFNNSINNSAMFMALYLLYVALLGVGMIVSLSLW